MAGWASEGIITNPASGALLADTGELGGKRYLVTLICWANVGMEMVFEHRNSVNSGNINSQVLPVTLSSFAVPINIKMQVNPNERLRVITRGAATGSCQASIFYA